MQRSTKTRLGPSPGRKAGTALKQMIDVFEKVGGPVLAVERVPADQVSNYGIVDIDPSVQLGPGIYAVRDLVEKPAAHEAPSNLAIIGRQSARNTARAAISP